MSSKMNDFMLQQLLSENQRLKRELELSKEAIKVSDACNTLIEFVTHTEDPFDKSMLSFSCNIYCESIILLILVQY